jgi:hypothetical protein
VVIGIASTMIIELRAGPARLRAAS